jgi:hypothetical protein
LFLRIVIEVIKKVIEVVSGSERVTVKTCTLNIDKNKVTRSLSPHPVTPQCGKIRLSCLLGEVALDVFEVPADKVVG